jgi:Tannase and feruloyl esterase
MRRAWTFAAGFALALAVFGAGAARAATPCEQLVGLQLKWATVTAAAPTPAGNLTACKIEVTSRPTADSDIRIEVWIPAGDAWNGRYVQLGNGGFAGQIASQRLAAVAAQGYAVAMTDDGHQTAVGTDASWAIGHPEKVVDFGWRALRETTLAAKGLIAAYAGQNPKYAYFEGCSDGGREALMEAQRFPDDFDGIVAGAPAYNFSGLLLLGAVDIQALAQPGAYLTAAKLKALETAALAQCGGGAYVADPTSCRFDPGAVACPGGQDRQGCLTAAELAAARVIYRGLATPEGKLLYPGYSPGAEAETGSWSAWLTGGTPDQADRALIHGFATGFWGGFVYGDPNFDLGKFDLAKAPRDAAKTAFIVDATDPDLSRFRAHGGKLIQYHGWNDPAVPARGSIVYYEQLKRRLGDPSGFYRLYMIPGMLHCGGGQGPSAVDWLALMQAWVEQAKAPADLVAQTRAPGGALGAPTQTLRPYGP